MCGEEWENLQTQMSNQQTSWDESNKTKTCGWGFKYSVFVSRCTPSPYLRLAPRYFTCWYDSKKRKYWCPNYYQTIFIKLGLKKEMLGIFLHKSILKKTTDLSSFYCSSPLPAIIVSSLSPLWTQLKWLNLLIPAFTFTLPEQTCDSSINTKP